MKRILLALFMISMVAGISAQDSRPFEVTKTTYDPYIAEKGGFDSLFVNPAGMAGQSEYFVFEVEAGTSGATSTYETLKLLLDNPSLFGGTATTNPTAADLDAIMVLLADNLSDADVATLFATTTLGFTTQAELATHIDGGGTITQADADIIAGNANSNPAIVENAAAGLTGDLKVDLEATVKLGTLISGFGIGLYGNAWTNLDATTLGVNPLIAETGVKLGYGFNLGPLGIGVSGDFAVIGNMPSSSVADLMSTSFTYGYAWGIDAGVTLDILPSLTVGAVLTDIIGSYSPAGSTSIDALMSGATPGALAYTYSFDLVLDFGVTWAPQIGNGKLLAPKFHVDYYNFIGLFMPDGPRTFQGVLNNMRIGAELELLSFINAKAMYYNEFFSVGAGVDIMFFEVFGEFKFNQQFTDIGGSVLVKLHF